MKALSEWVPTLGSYVIPVLRGTVKRLNELSRQEDRVTARDISNVVLRDPLMTLSVLRYSQSRLRPRQPTEVTTVEHAIMMHGVVPFFREFARPLVLEDVLAGYPEGLSGAARVLSRAHHAALTARHFSALRHDIESEEVVTGALLHDLAELLLWCTAPTIAVQLDHMLRTNPGLRSTAAQFAVLGFPLGELQIALAREWRLPAMLRSLMDDRESGNARVKVVRLSVAVARHSAHGWFDPALPDDYVGLQKLTFMSVEQVRRAVRYCALQAARDWQQFGVRPAAAWLPMLPGEAGPIEPSSTPLGPSMRSEVLKCVLEQLSAARQRRVDERAIIAVACYGMEVALGLRRIWFGTVNAKSAVVTAKHSLMCDSGLLPGQLSFPVGSKILFDRLLERAQAVFYQPDRTPTLAKLLPAALRQLIAHQPFYAVGLHSKNGPFGLLYADAGTSQVPLDETRYNAFKQIGLLLGQALEKAASA